MSDELSCGLPPLVTSANLIVRVDTMRAVLLRGVNRSGLEYSEPGDGGFLATAQFTEEEAREIVLGWHANVVRVPFNQDWALHGRSGHSAEEYLASLDRVISWFSSVGAYTILDLQWLDADTVYGHTASADGVMAGNHVAPLPNADTIALWRTLAARYRDEPAVLFDLFNEPHDRLADDAHPISLIDRHGNIVTRNRDFIGRRQWTPWAERLIAEIRSIRPDGLILVGGLDWAFDLRRIRVKFPNIVYSTHIYANRPASAWSKALGGATEVPVFVGEWGGTDNDTAFGRNLADLMARNGLGWTAWSWADYPRLVLPPSSPDYRPTTFGELVRQELCS